MAGHQPDAGHGGLLEPDPPAPGTVFRTIPRGTAIVQQLVVDGRGNRTPVTFLVRDTAGGFWSLQSTDPILDGIAYLGTRIPDV